MDQIFVYAKAKLAICEENSEESKNSSLCLKYLIRYLFNNLLRNLIFESQIKENIMQLDLFWRNSITVMYQIEEILSNMILENSADPKSATDST